MLTFLSAAGFSKLITLECPDTNDAELNELIVSDYLTPRNILKPSLISVSGVGSPEIMIADSGIWVTSGSIVNGQRIKIRTHSSPLYSTTTIVTITISNTTFSWKIKTRKALITPNPFVFQPKLNEELSTTVYSDFVILDGFEIAVPVSIVGDNSPTFSINNGPFVNSSMIYAGQTIRLKVTSANTFSTIHKCILSVSNVRVNFVVLTREKINTPLEFEFDNLNNVGLGSNFTSNAIIPSGYDNNLTISIENGEYCINNDGLWKSQPGEIIPGQSIKLRTTSSTDMATAKLVKLNLGDFTTTWCVTTATTVINPDVFLFDPILNVDINSEVISDTVIITGLDPNNESKISVSSNNSLKYLINDQVLYTNISNTINTGDSISLSMVSAQTYLTNAIGFVTVNGFSAPFRLKTKSPKTSPSPFQLYEIVDVEPDVFIESNTVTISNIDIPVRISIFGSGNPQFCLNNSSTWQTTGLVANGQTLKVRLVSSQSPLTKLMATIVINDLVVNFLVTTRDQKITPNNFEFIQLDNVPLQSYNLSNTVTITGIDAAAPVVVRNGMYRINNFNFTDTNGLVNNGDRLQLMVDAASTTNTTTTVTVSVGSLVRNFSVTTEVDVICNSFVLTPKTNNINDFELIESEKYRLSGFDIPLNVYMQNMSNNMQAQISITTGLDDTDNWKSVIDSNTPITQVRSGQYISIRGISDDYSSNTILERHVIVRVAPTPTTGITSTYSLTSSRLALDGNIYGNPIRVSNADAASEVYYYSELLLIDATGDQNSTPTRLTKLYFAIRVNRNFPESYIQISLNGGVDWESGIINNESPYGCYVDDAQQILVRCKVPQDYENYFDFFSSGYSMVVNAMIWNVPESQIQSITPLVQKLLISVPKF